MVTTTPDDFNGLNLDGIATTSPSIPRKLGASAIKPAPEDIPLNKKLCDRAKLTNVGWDCTAASFHLPALTENGEWIYRCPDRTSIKTAMANMFANIPDALAKSTDFLHREVDLPYHNPLVYAQYITTYYKVSTMQSIELTGESKKRFCSSTSSQTPSPSLKNASLRPTTAKPKSYLAKPRRTSPRSRQSS
jgi:hypothetical protein